LAHWIDRGCAARGQVPGSGSHQGEDEQHTAEGDWISHSDSIEQAADGAREHPGSRDAEQHPHGGKRHGLAESVSAQIAADAPWAMRIPTSCVR
jgi:hypothetical protein